MIEHVWSLICNSSSIDEENHTISIFNILEQLSVFSNTPDMVSLPIHLEIFSLLTREDEKVPAQGKMRIFFCDPADSCTQKAELDIDLKNAVYFRSRIRVDGLDLKGNGKYKFVVELQQKGKKAWEKVASLPLLINFQPLPADLEQNLQIE